MGHHALYYRGSSINASLALGRYAQAVALVNALPKDVTAYAFAYVSGLAYACVGERAAAREFLERAYAMCPELRDDLRGEVTKWFLDDAIAAELWARLEPLAQPGSGRVARRRTTRQ